VTSNSARCLGAWLFAAVLLFRGGSAVQQSVSARNWPAVDATVLESDARWVEHHRAVGRSMWSHQLHLRYSYTVGGRGYIGTRASFSAWGQNESFNPFSWMIARRCPVGTRVLAHYDVMDPSRSVLDPAARWSAWIALILGALAARLGLVYSRRVTAEKNAMQGPRYAQHR
jgi:hypothetical protein